MSGLYDLNLSEGAIANLLQRVQVQLETPVAKIIERLRSARLVGSDEITSEGEQPVEMGVSERASVFACDSSQSWRNGYR